VQAIRNAFRFIKASLSLALKQVQLQEPWFALALGGLVILFIWFLPIGAVTWLIGLTPLGLSLIGLLALLALVSLLIWGEITTLLTSHSFASIGSDEIDDMPGNLNFLGAHAGAVLVLTLTLPLLSLGNWLRNLFAKPDAAPWRCPSSPMRAPRFRRPWNASNRSCRIICCASGRTSSRSGWWPV
jgi:hypothetical protein